MIISTREYLSFIKRGTNESLEQYKKEMSRIDGLIKEHPNVVLLDALTKIRRRYEGQVQLYEEERARCLMNIQHLPTRDQSQAVYMYVMEDNSWEQISVDRCTTFEAARSLVLRGFLSYEKLYGSKQEIDERIFRGGIR